MRHVIKLFLAASLIVGFSSTAAFAASPHIVGRPSADVSGNTLTLSASVAGLGNVSEVTLGLNGSVDVFSRCYNHGGNKPQADNKQETIAVTDFGTFPVRNGRTNATFSVTPLSSLDCPGNQVAVIESVTYSLALTYEGKTLYTFISA